MKYTPKDIGQIIHVARKNLGVTQKALALTSGTGLRFIIDLEKGKPTCQIGKTLTVLNTLGVTIKIDSPTAFISVTAGSPVGRLGTALAGINALRSATKSIPSAVTIVPVPTKLPLSKRKASKSEPR